MPFEGCRSIEDTRSPVPVEEQAKLLERGASRRQWRGRVEPPAAGIKIEKPPEMKPVSKRKTDGVYIECMKGKGFCTTRDLI